MKWLFMVLVALNIAVFGGTVGYKLLAGQTPVQEAVNAAPFSPDLSASAPAASEPVVQTASSASEPDAVLAASDILSDEEAAQLRQKELEQKQREKEKKQREEKARRERLAAKAKEAEAEADEEHVGSKAGCTPQASLVMDEDDYHRIKGLLGKWSHVASRSVEKRTTPKAQTVHKTYRVVLPQTGSFEEQTAELSAKGFSGMMFNGELSMGVSGSRKSAQNLLSRLNNAGFGGGRIVEHTDEAEKQDESQSISRMTVLFTAVDAHDAQEIRKIIAPYGTLNIKSCK